MSLPTHPIPEPADVALTIAPESPDQPAVAALFAEADAHSRSLYEDDSQFLIYADAISGPQARFLLARLGGRAVGCGALMLLGGREAEVKRVFVSASVRQRGVGRALMAAIESLARKEGVAVLLLETGRRNREALGLYRRLGFTGRPRFGTYAFHPDSVFLEKVLEPRS